MSVRMDTHEFVEQKTIYTVLQRLVLQACKLKYPAALLEVDGIICISFLSSTEQHVVKIHERLNNDLQIYDAEETGVSVSTSDSKLLQEKSVYQGELSNDLKDESLMKKSKNNLFQKSKIQLPFQLIDSGSEDDETTQIVDESEISRINIGPFAQCGESENSPVLGSRLDESQSEEKECNKRNNSHIGISEIPNHMLVECDNEDDISLISNEIKEIDSTGSVDEIQLADDSSNQIFETESTVGRTNSLVDESKNKFIFPGEKNENNENFNMTVPESVEENASGPFKSIMLLQLKKEPPDDVEYDKAVCHLSRQVLSTDITSDKEEIDPHSAVAQTTLNADKSSEILITIKDEPADLEEGKCLFTKKEHDEDEWQRSRDIIHCSSVGTTRDHCRAGLGTGMKLPINMYRVSESQKQHSKNLRSPSAYQCMDSGNVLDTLDSDTFYVSQNDQNNMFYTTEKSNDAVRLQSPKYSNDNRVIPSFLTKMSLNSAMSENGAFNAKRKSCSNINLAKKRKNFVHDGAYQNWHAFKPLEQCSTPSLKIDHSHRVAPVLHSQKLYVRYPLVRNKPEIKHKSSFSDIPVARNLNCSANPTSAWMNDQDTKNNSFEISDHNLARFADDKKLRLEDKNQDMLQVKLEPHSPSNSPISHFKTSTKLLTHNRSLDNLLPGASRKSLLIVRSPQKHEKKYFCAHCGVGFTKQSSRHRHERTKCEANEYKTEFMCNVCGKAFLRHDSMLRHLQNIHHMGK